MRALPMLEPRRTALEKCVFCPKLCRSACPVSNTEPRETITPWGKMSAVWMAAHADVPLDPSHAAPAWACTGCYGCREACDHKNPVADVLFDGRNALTRRGVAPAAAMAVLRGFARHDRRTRAAVQRLSRDAAVRDRIGDGEGPALLVGCGYARALHDEARDAAVATAALLQTRIALIEGCCGLPLRQAGDTDAFARHARGMKQRLDAHSRVVVADPGCALALEHMYPHARARILPPVEPLVSLAARHIGALCPERGGYRGAHDPPRGPVRWHDPCQLGRGLGIYDAPRAVLARMLGRPPDEFDDHRNESVCSGGGGLLPATMPDVARAMGDARVRAHARAGGGRIVTACASSLLGRTARGTGVEVDDLATWIARGARAARAAPGTRWA
jgi:Fe-S oxidoreductase